MDGRERWWFKKEEGGGGGGSHCYIDKNTTANTKHILLFKECLQNSQPQTWSQEIVCHRILFMYRCDT